MIYKTLAILVVVLLVGCTGGNAMTSQQDFKTLCLGGVTYYVTKESLGNNGYGYMSVKLDKDSKVVVCD